MHQPARQVKKFRKGRHSRTAGVRHRFNLYAVRFQPGQVGQILLPGKREADDLVPAGEVSDDIEHHRAAAVRAGVGQIGSYE